MTGSPGREGSVGQDRVADEFADKWHFGREYQALRLVCSTEGHFSAGGEAETPPLEGDEHGMRRSIRAIHSIFASAQIYAMAMAICHVSLQNETACVAHRVLCVVQLTEVHCTVRLRSSSISAAECLCRVTALRRCALKPLRFQIGAVLRMQLDTPKLPYLVYLKHFSLSYASPLTIRRYF